MSEQPGTEHKPVQTPAPGGDAAAPAPTPRPVPRPIPRPVPRPPLPGASPAAAAKSAQSPAPVVPVANESAEIAAAGEFGRVEVDGTVYVKDSDGERVVGQYTDGDADAAIAFYARRYLDLKAQVVLLETRVSTIAVKDAESTLARLSAECASPAAVGDLPGLRERLLRLEELVGQRRAEAAAEREAAKAVALAEREAIVAEVESIAAQPVAQTQWRDSATRIATLLEQWKQAQRHGVRVDRPSEEALWKRFSKARTSFDKSRRAHFAELDKQHAAAKAAKERLVARAQELATSTDWGPTGGAYRALMEEWKAAGRTSRKEDDALWEQFKAAQDQFFAARNEQNSAIDAEYEANLQVKLAILAEAEALIPVTNLSAARRALRDLQDRWEEAGKVPRAEVQRVEGRLRAVEKAVKDAEQSQWERSNPETRARVEGFAARLQESIASLEGDLARAQAAGDAKGVARAEAALVTQRAWLKQATDSGR